MGISLALQFNTARFRAKRFRHSASGFIKSKIETKIQNYSNFKDIIKEILLFILTGKYIISVQNEINSEEREKEEIIENINAQFQNNIMTIDEKNTFKNFINNIDTIIAELLNEINDKNYSEEKINETNERKKVIKNIIETNIKENENSINEFIKKIDDTNLNENNDNSTLDIKTIITKEFDKIKEKTLEYRH